MTTIAGVVTALLLGCGVLVAVAGTVGTLLTLDPLRRLHFVGAVSSIATPAIAAAVLVDGTAWSTAAELVLLVVVLLVAGPAVAHALARAAHVRERGGWQPEPDVATTDPGDP